VFEEKTLKLQTRCHQCIFAQFDKNVQTGCELGRSKEYRKQGKTERKMLDGVDAYEISTACTTYRDDEWLDAHVEEHRTYIGDSTLAGIYESAKEEVRNFVKPQVDFIIVENTTDDVGKIQLKLIKTINSILGQDILPRSVVFVVNNDPMFKEIRTVLDLIDSLMIDSDIKYQLVRNVELPVEYYRLLDVGVGKTSGTYYTHYELGAEVPKNLLNSFDVGINDSMWTVCYVEHELINNLDVDFVPKEEIVQRSLHKLLGGNEGAYIQDKITQLAESQQVKNKMMFTWEQLDAKKLS
jgi:hypothetical protein